MSQSRHLIAATAFLLAGMLVPALTRAAAVTQLHVHLQIRSSCAVHMDPKATRAPDVSCSHGQPAFAISRMAIRALPKPPATAITLNKSTAATATAAPEVWVVTF